MNKLLRYSYYKDFKLVLIKAYYIDLFTVTSTCSCMSETCFCGIW